MGIKKPPKRSKTKAITVRVSNEVADAIFDLMQMDGSTLTSVIERSVMLLHANPNGYAGDDTGQYGGNTHPGSIDLTDVPKEESLDTLRSLIPTVVLTPGPRKSWQEREREKLEKAAAAKGVCPDCGDAAEYCSC